MNTTGETLRYLDATVFVYAALFQGPKSARAVDLLRSAAASDDDFATCALTVDEVVHKLTKYLDRPAALAYGEKILTLPSLRLVPVGAEEARSALALMRKHPHLRPRDAIHAAAAYAVGAQAIVTDDADFDRLPEVKREPL